jgi:hypothetical protein
MAHDVGPQSGDESDPGLMVVRVALSTMDVSVLWRHRPKVVLDNEDGDVMADVQKILESLNQEERLALERALKGAAGEQRDEEVGNREEGCCHGHHHHHCGCHHHHHHHHHHCCCC